jgi:hypothetical protein
METIASILKFVTAVGAIISALYTIYRWIHPKPVQESSIVEFKNGYSFSLSPETRRKLRTPGIFLLFCGAINLGLGMLMFFQFSMMAIANNTVPGRTAFPDQSHAGKEETDSSFRQMMWFHEQHRQREATMLLSMAVSWFCMAMVGAISVAGASAMLRGGSYRLAFAGSLAGMLDLGCLCSIFPFHSGASSSFTILMWWVKGLEKSHLKTCSNGRKMLPIQPGALIQAGKSERVVGRHRSWVNQATGWGRSINLLAILIIGNAGGVRRT